MIPTRRPEVLTSAVAGVAAFAIYAATAFPSVSWWESGEYAAAAATFGIPRSPGAPLYLLTARIAALIPDLGDTARRLNMLSALFASTTVLLVCRIAFEILRSLFGEWIKTRVGAFAASGGALIAGLSLAFADTFWSAAVETGIGAPSALTAALIIFVAMLWRRSATARGDARRLMMLAFLFGLATAVSRDLILLAIPAGMLVGGAIFGRGMRGFAQTGLMTAGLFVLMYYGALIAAPSAAASLFGGYPAGISLLLLIVAAITILLALGGIISRVTRSSVAATCSLAVALYLAGTSLNAVIPIRAAQDPALNIGAAGAEASYSAYLAEGDFSRGSSVFVRGRNPSGMQSVGEDSDAEIFLDQQLNRGFIRYVLWNFSGRAGDDNGSPAVLFGGARAVESLDGGASAAYPNVYYALPLLLALGGMFQHLRLHFPGGFFLLLVFVTMSVGLTFARNPEMPMEREEDRAVIPVLMVMSIWIGTAAGCLARAFARRFGGKPAAAVFVLLAAFYAAPGRMFAANAYEHDRSRDYSARDAAYNKLQGCEQGAVLFTQGDNDYWPLLYLQEANRIRRDVRLVNLGLLGASWHSMQSVSPGRSGKPVPTSFTMEELSQLPAMGRAAILKTGWISDRRELRIPVGRDTMRTFVSETLEGAPRAAADSLARLRRGSAMIYSAQASHPVALDGSGELVRYFRPWRDVFLNDIIAAAAWHRPLHFTPECMDGIPGSLQDFMRLDGAVFRLTPVRSPGAGAIRRSSLRETALNRVDAPRRSPERGLLLTHAAGAGGYLPPESRENLRWQRALFLRLADYETRVAGDAEAAARALSAMERAFPLRSFPMDAREAFDLGVLYHKAGDRKAAARIFMDVEKRLKREIRQGPRNAAGLQSPYRYLLDIAMMQGRRDDALDLLRELERLFPNAADVRRKRDALLDESLKATETINNNRESS